MKKTYALYTRFILKGIKGCITLTVAYILRALYHLVCRIIRLVKSHPVGTIATICIALLFLNVWQLVYYKTERLKIESRCDSLYTKSLATKSYYDKGYQDGLKYQYKFQ